MITEEEWKALSLKELGEHYLDATDSQEAARLLAKESQEHFVKSTEYVNRLEKILAGRLGVCVLVLDTKVLMPVIDSYKDSYVQVKMIADTTKEE